MVSLKIKSHILVIGSINNDYFVDVKKLPILGETLLGKNGFICTGGKGANTALTCSKLGAKTTFLFTFGFDGMSLYHKLNQKGINLSLSNQIGIYSGQAFIFSLPGGENSIIVNSGANFCWPPLNQKQINIIGKCDCILLQREIPSQLNLRIAQIASFSGVPILLDAGGQDTNIPYNLLNLTSVFSPNETEICRVIDTKIKTKDQWAKELRLKFGLKYILIKLGEQGVYYENDKTKIHHTAFSVTLIDTTGAGDCFTGAFSIRFANKQSIQDCLRFASATGALQVTKKGTLPSIPTIYDIEKLLNKI